MDHTGIIWIGTIGGISTFDGSEFTSFIIPESKPGPLRGVTSSKIVHHIIEDSKNKMWFASGSGAYIYDGSTLTNISEKEGLCNKSVNCILEDKKSIVWFATHYNGVCNWDGISFRHITEEKDGVKGSEVRSLYEDYSGTICFPVEHSGVYKYDGTSFVHYHKEEGLTSGGIQCTFE